MSWIWFAIHLVGLKGSWSFFSRFFVTCCFCFLGVEDDTAAEWAVEVRERGVEGEKVDVAVFVVGLAVGVAEVGNWNCLLVVGSALDVMRGERGGVGTREGATGVVGWGLGITMVGEWSCLERTVEAEVREGGEGKVDVVGSKEG